ncbi:MAG: hypothetical protein JWM92_553 [Candidatus Nomurabacteria bacterium]|nr:hypothetical protein [Candidatus Nomurabacteria bacterium]
MKNLFEASRVEEIKDRVSKLKPDSQHLWGKMNTAQMLAHCSKSLRMALGETRPPLMFLGRIIGFLIKPFVFKNDDPMRQGSPTIKGLEVCNERDFETERTALYQLIDRFANAAPREITIYPHSFFGKLTPQEWAILMYKHLDHHLRQFGV